MTKVAATMNLTNQSLTKERRAKKRRTAMTAWIRTKRHASGRATNYELNEDSWCHRFGFSCSYGLLASVAVAPASVDAVVAAAAAATAAVAAAGDGHDLSRAWYA